MFILQDQEDNQNVETVQETPKANNAPKRRRRDNNTLSSDREEEAYSI